MLINPGMLLFTLKCEIKKGYNCQTVICMTLWLPKLNENKRVECHNVAAAPVTFYLTLGRKVTFYLTNGRKENFKTICTKNSFFNNIPAI